MDDRRTSSGGRLGWVLDELMTVGRENLDEVHVGQYDDKEDAGAADEVALLAGWGLDGRSVVVDRRRHRSVRSRGRPRCAQVVAVDISPVMLRRLQAKVEASGLRTSSSHRPAS